MCVCVCVFCLSSTGTSFLCLEDPPCRSNQILCGTKISNTCSHQAGSFGGNPSKHRLKATQEERWSGLQVAASIQKRQQAVCGEILSCGSSHPAPVGFCQFSDPVSPISSLSFQTSFQQTPFCLSYLELDSVVGNCWAQNFK